MNRKKHQYKAFTYVGLNIVLHLDMEVFSKKEVEKRIKRMGYEIKDWVIEKVY